MNPLADASLTDALTAAIGLVVPEAALVGTACVLFVVGLVTPSRAVALLTAAAGLVAAAVLAVVFHQADVDAFAATGFASPIRPGPAAVFARWLTLGLGAVFLLVTTREAGRGIAADYHGCLFVLLAGCSLTARANDLVSLYLALEMISVPTYVLLYLPGQTKAAQEAAVKYFLLSVLSSAVTLFGFSYLYGLAGSTNLSAVVHALREAHHDAVSPLATLAMVFAVAGLGFRITAVPFHYYAPDVYQGGPTGVVAVLAVVPKVAGFYALAALLGLTQAPATDLPFPAATQIPLFLWVLAAVTMTVGNVLALVQDNLKRLLAYSGVAHGGYMLIGLLSSTAYGPADAAALPAFLNGWDATLFYLVAYAMMTIGAFAVIAHLHADDRPAESIDDLAGAGQSNPLAAAAMAVALLSLIGLPLTAGFSGKLLLFFGAFDAPETGGLGGWYRILTLVAAVNAAIGAVYYLRILGVMYLRSPLRPIGPGRVSGPLLAAVLCAAGTIALGAYPKPLADAARWAAPTTPAAGGR